MITPIKRTLVANMPYILTVAILTPIILGGVGLILAIEWLAVLFTFGIIELVALVIIMAIFSLHADGIL